jgi:hypothetical protein
MPKMPISASTAKPSPPEDRDSKRDVATDQEPLPAAVEKKSGKSVLLRRTMTTDVARESTEEG